MILPRAGLCRAAVTGIRAPLSLYSDREGLERSGPQLRGDEMKAPRVVLLLLAGTAQAALVYATPPGIPGTPGPPVSVSVEIDGEPAPLYPALDGSQRFYLEAREGRRYSLRLANRSGQRVGVVLAVDGLNAISGNREEGRGRMYVLDPWQSTRIRGWRSSLQEVREFTFVDERASYAARSGKANGKLGWIELTVYRERDAVVRQAPRSPDPGWLEPFEEQEAPAGERPRHEKRSDRSNEAPAPSAASGSERSYPGTGWGRRSHDPVMLVDFQPEAHAAQTVTLRYEYRTSLVALGVLPRRAPADRLRERERAEWGFAQPPLW